jgi:hypothetical protein
MTLVVGYADEEIGFLVGDTLLSHQYFQLADDVGPVDGEFHSLKIQILSGNIAVAFAGLFDPAYAAVRELKSVLDRDSAIDPATWLSEKGGVGQCEFLVLTLRGGLRRLVRVANGQVREGRRFYIGMQEEYARYLNLRRPYTGPLVRIEPPSNIENAVTVGEKEFDVVASAIETLANDSAGRKFEVVGAISGCVIRVVDARISRELEYMQSVMVSNFPWEPEGGYTMLASAEDTRGIGIYFRAGKRGFMMPVGGEIPCVEIEAEDVETFVELGRERFGMELVGGTWLFNVNPAAKS